MSVSVDERITVQITVLSRIGEERVHEYGHIVLSTSEQSEGTLNWQSEDGTYTGFLQSSDEGILWIRGHHTRDSEPVAAMRVAFALGTHGT